MRWPWTKPAPPPPMQRWISEVHDAMGQLAQLPYVAWKNQLDLRPCILQQARRVIACIEATQRAEIQVAGNVTRLRKPEEIA